MSYCGDYQLEDATIRIPFTTRAFATGIPTALVSGVVDIYEDVTATPIITAETLGVSIGSQAGFNVVTIDAAAASGFENDKTYTAILDAGTVGGVSVISEVVGWFTIGKSAANKQATVIVEDTGTTIPALLPAALVGGRIDANVGAISADATAADNLELDYDGTGYAKANSTIGTCTTNTDVRGTDSAALASVCTEARLAELDAANLPADIDALRATQVSASGTADSGSTTTLVDAALTQADDNWWNGQFIRFTSTTLDGQVAAITDFVAATDTLTFFPAVTTAVVTHTYEILPASTLGIAWQVSEEILTGSTHNTATSLGRRIRQLQESGSVYNGQIWVDTVNGVAGTTDYENGTSDNHVDLIASAKTLSASVGIPDFHIINGSSVTLAESTVDESYFGDNWVLALGGQDIAGAYIQGATVSGVGVSASEVHFEGCEIGTSSLQIAHCDFCSFTGTVTHTLAGDYNYHNCYSKIAGAAAPIFTKTAGQAVTAQFRNWSGGITLSGLQSGDTVTLSGTFGTITLNGADATVEIRGTYKSIVNNLTGAPTVNIAGAMLAADLAAILVDTGTTIPATLGTPADTDLATDIATIDTVVDAVKAVTDLLPDAGALSDLALILADTAEIGTAGAGLTDLGGTLTELTGVPADDVNILKMVGWLYIKARNKITQTATTQLVRDDADGATVGTSTVSDDGTTAIRGEYI